MHVYLGGRGGVGGACIGVRGGVSRGACIGGRGGVGGACIGGRGGVGVHACIGPKAAALPYTHLE